MNKKRRHTRVDPLEKRGHSVRCSVCGAEGGSPCHDEHGRRLSDGQTHAERKKRAAVFAEMRRESAKMQRRRRPSATKAAKEIRANRRRNGPVVVKHAADLSPADRARYGL